MRRPRGELKSKKILVCMTPTMFNEIAQIAKTDDRRKGAVVRFLTSRGLARYYKDGRIREPHSAITPNTDGRT